MSTPAVNPDGYNTSAVHDMAGFNAIDFALAHGSGDDNGKHALQSVFSWQEFSDDTARSAVHFANTAHLLDMFTVHRVRKFRFRMFTDR